MTACQTSSPLANQICYLLTAWSPLSEIYHMASTAMDGRAVNSLGTRIIIAVKAYQSQKKQLLLASSLHLCAWYKMGCAELLIHELKWLPVHKSVPADLPL